MTNELSTERAIEALYTVRAYYASLTAGYPKGKDCRGIGDVMCSEIANSCFMAIKALEQQPKTGYWEYVQYDSNPNIGNWHCSECGGICTEMHSIEDAYNYCPNCGARMESEETE